MKYLTITLILIINSFLVFAQKHGTGAILDESQFQTVLRAPILTRGDFTKLPDHYSLKKFCPPAGDQGTTSTCTGWAVSYAARTIMSAVNNKWNINKTSKNAFSPSFIYNEIRNVNSCKTGTSLIDALNVLQKEGTLPLKDFGYDCKRKVTKKDKIKASAYRIREFRQISDRYDKNKVLNIKKSISQKKPVIIGIDCPDSFYDVKDVWHPTKKDYKINSNGHALAVVAYDDHKYGGAVQILNSWGNNWADSGFAWIKYKDLQHFCVWAGEMIGMQNTDSYSAAADIFLKKVGKEKIKLKLNKNYLTTASPLHTGDQFQLFIENKTPVYLNVISWDTTHVLKKLFPNNLLESSYLAYSSNYLIFPHENYAFEIDSTEGITNFVLLFSSFKIDIDKFIVSSLKSHFSYGKLLTSKLLTNYLPENSGINIKYSNKIILNAYSRKQFVQPIHIKIIK